MTAVQQADVLIEAACQILENQVFMFGEPCEKAELIGDSNRYVMASVDFEGPVVGQCFWIVSEQFTTELAANMLGVEPDDSAAISGGIDALEELSNVVCCQFLTLAYGSEPFFSLDSPNSQPIGDTDWSLHIKSSDTVGLVVDDHPILLGLILKSALN